MTTKDEIRTYFKTAPLAEAQTELEVAAMILSMRPNETIAAPKKGRPPGSKSKKPKLPEIAAVA